MWKWRRNRGLIVLGVSALAYGSAWGQLQDGDFDNLNVGTNPDCDNPAGAWHWPDIYQSNALCETSPEQLQIVATSSFDSGAVGNSLQMNVNSNTANIHLTNIGGRIDEASGVIVESFFDIWIEPDVSGASVYLGGDHGGGGFSNASDRGPQITFTADGNIAYANSAGQNTNLATYARRTWITIRMVVDMSSDTYDLFAGPRDGQLTMIGDDLGFRVAAGINHIDRFTRAHFGATTPLTNAYIDNVSVEIMDTGPSLQADGTCPGGGPIRVRWTDATPNGTVALLFASNQGSVVIPPGNPCDGTQLGLGANQLQVAFQGDAGPNGERILNSNAPGAACGGFLQLLDVTTCGTSNVVQIQ